MSPLIWASLVVGASSLDWSAIAIHLSDAKQLAAWESLRDEWRVLAEDGSDALMALPVRTELGTRAETWLEVRRACRQRLEGLPTVLLDPERQRLAESSKSMLADGLRRHDVGLLRRLVDTAPFQAEAETAKAMLGEWALEEGEFAVARQWWSQLRDDGRGLALVLLTMIYEGRWAEARDRLAEYAEKHPRAAGRLAGRVGVYHSILREEWTRGVKECAEHGAPDEQADWSTFGGAATRGRAAARLLQSRLWEDGPTWRIALPRVEMPKIAEGEGGTIGRAAARLAYHPVIVNDQVLYADGRSVVCRNLMDGSEQWTWQLDAPAKYPNGPMPRFTLSVDRDRAYVRLGGQTLALPGNPKKRTEPSWIICLDLRKGLPKGAARELWRVAAPAADSPAFFEGSPLVVGNRVYVASSRVVEGKTKATIVCYDRDGKARWSSEVCDCQELSDAHPTRSRHHLLTWADGKIVYCSHAGAIVAVDAATGSTVWGVRYPSRGPASADGTPSQRDLTPALAMDDTIIAAPMDTDHVFALNAATGEVLWDSELPDVVHLLGGGQRRVVATTSQGLVGFDLVTGDVAWRQPDAGRLGPRGRGLIAGGWILWPTLDARLPWRAVTLRDGMPRRDTDDVPVFAEPAVVDPSLLASLPAGNVAWGQGCLLIATGDELVAYVRGR